MKPFITIILLFMSFGVQADFYGYVGIAYGESGYHHHPYDYQWDCESVNGEYRCTTDDDAATIHNPLGLLEMGYRYKRFDFFIMHISSIPDHDRSGFNLAGIKYRLW